MSLATESQGPYLKLKDGQRFYLEQPDLSLITIEAIAEGLSREDRFQHQAKAFYSVAQHVCLCSDYVKLALGGNTHEQMAALMHDAAEWLLSDVVRNVKSFSYFMFRGEITPFRVVEQHLLDAIHDALGVPVVGQLTKAADESVLAAEIQQLTAWDPADAVCRDMDALAAPFKIRPWSPDEGKDNFLQRYYQLADVFA